jgi:serine/threonine-protein kinase
MANVTTLEQFRQSIVGCGLMSPEELAEYLDTFPVEKRPETVDHLARELVRDGRLTCGQIDLLLAGREKMIFLGNYTLQECLGKGGMGEVFKAIHHCTRRVVAVKVLREFRETDLAVRRFWQEAKLASKLNHPNIVTVFDIGQNHDVNYLVMEYVEGRDLGRLIRKHGPLPLCEAVGYILQAARGLDYAHQRNVIHRDIKPSNLLRQSNGPIKILDLGLARMAIDEASLPPDATRMERLTQSGELLGTVDYLSPEQALDARRADHRTDIYSLGCTMYTLLTCKPVFDAETYMRKLIAHASAPIPRLGSSVSGTPECLEEVFQAMLAKQPQDRIGSMSEVVRSLESCMPKLPPPLSIKETVYMATPHVDCREIQAGETDLRGART